MVGAGTLRVSLGVIRAGRLGRVLRPGRVLPGLADPGPGLGRLGLRACDRLVPLLPRRRHLIPRSPRLLLGGGRRLPSLGQPRLSLRRRSACLPCISLSALGTGLKPGPGLLAGRDLRLQPGPQLGPVPLGVPAGLLHLLLRGPPHPVQLRAGRLGRLPRPRRILPGLAGPGLGLGRPRLRACHRLVPLPPRRGRLLPRLLGLCLRGLPRGHRPLLSGGLRRQRLAQPRLSLRRRSTRLPRISLRPLAAPPKREPRPTRIPRVSRPATVPGHHLRHRNPVNARCGPPVTGPGSPQYPCSAAPPGRGSFSQPGQAHLRTSSPALTIRRLFPLTRTA